MDRHRYRDSIEAIEAVRSTLPDGFKLLLQGVDFVGDYCSGFLGLCRHKKASYGRNYSQTSHVIYKGYKNSEPKSRKVATIVLMEDGESWEYKKLVILHEIGHAIHERLGFVEPFVALDDYAATNKREAFATSFQSFCSEGIDMKHYHNKLYVQEKDPLAYYFFGHIANNSHINFRVNQ